MIGDAGGVRDAIPPPAKWTGISLALGNPGAMVAVILVVAIAIRILPLTYSHFWDETVFLQHARIIVDGRTNYDEFFHRPPLLPFLYAAGFLLWDSVYMANIVQGLVSGLAVLFAFLYVRGRFGNGAGLAAAALFAFAPYGVARSHELLTDEPAIALMLACAWLFDQPRTRFALATGVVFALAVAMRFTCIFFVFYLMLDALVPPRKLRQLFLAGCSAAATIAPYLLWNYERFGSMLFPFKLASRIVHEWTAPVPAVFYWHALGELLPPTAWLAFAFGLWAVAARPSRARQSARLDARERAARAQRCAVWVAWGGAFLAYMLAIPHKEVRYLLPLTIPVLVLAAAGLAAAATRVRALPAWPRLCVLAIAGVLAVIDFGTAFEPLTRPPVDATRSSEVEIADYVRGRAQPTDTLYAAHNFPVFAFYSGLRTVSLLPIQDTFATDWKTEMTRPGFLVYSHPERMGEIHATNPALKPDRAFLESHREFSVERVFPTATVYRYVPTGEVR